MTNSGNGDHVSEDYSTLDETSSVTEQIQGPQKPSGFRFRVVQVLFLCTGLAVSDIIRLNLFVAIQAMTRKSKNPHVETYNWDSLTIALLLISFFLGYIILIIPAGILAQKFGAKLILLLAIALSSISTLLIPVAALGGWPVIFVLRVFQGLCIGLTYPCAHAILAKWVPVDERSFLNTLTYTGSLFGSAVILATGDAMVRSSFGWSLVFYASGVVGIIWSIFWWIFGDNLPSESKFIKPLELAYIEESLGVPTKDCLKTPWKKIFSSMPFWALLLAHIAQIWGIGIVSTVFLVGMYSILNANTESVIYAATPYIIMTIVALCLSPVSDLVINKGHLKTGTSRKVFNSVAFICPALLLVGTVFVDSKELVFAFMVLAAVLNSGNYVGFMVNHLDLSPNFAGILMGLTNGIAIIISLLGSIAIGLFVETDAAQYNWILIGTAALYIVSNFIFCFGSGNKQPWDDEVAITNKNDEEQNNVNTTD